jgi:phosphoserine phosphatase RsbU/P
MLAQHDAAISVLARRFSLDAAPVTSITLARRIAPADSYRHPSFRARSSPRSPSDSNCDRLVKPSLKIHDPAADITPTAAQGRTALDELCAAFGNATGWSLRLHENQSSSDLAPSNSNTSSTGVSPGTVSLELSPGPLTAVRTPRKLAEPLARAIARLLGEVASTRHAIWEREAELAAGIPVAARPAQPEVLAERLDGILRGGCEAIDCTAAGLYLLDAGTTELKLRSSWGLARFKLTEPPRTLRGATADLEALTGHAVVLANEQLCRLWHTPEPAEAALCVPVSSPTMPLGTLWFFAQSERDFNDRQTQLAEIVAGRLAAELEREVLLGDAASRAASDRQDKSRKHWDTDQAAIPKLDVPGWSLAADIPAGFETASFADAFITDHDTVAIVLGASQLAGPEAQLAIAALRTAVRAHAMRHRRASAVIHAVHHTLSAAFPGNVSASLAVALVHPRSGYMHFAATGQVAATINRPKRSRRLQTTAAKIGGEDELQLIEERARLAANEQLKICADAQDPPAPQAMNHSKRPSLVVSRTNAATSNLKSQI